MTSIKKRIQSVLSTLIVFFALAFIWWLAGQSDISNLKLPRIGEVIDSAGRRSDELVDYSKQTLIRVIAGLTVGCSLGWLVGLSMFFISWIRTFLEPLIELIRPIPPAVLIPFMILWVGVGTISQIIVVALGAFMVMAVATYEACSSLPERYVLTALSLGARPVQVIRQVVAPAIRPHLIGPFRVATGTAFGLTIAAEYLGAQGGLGYLVRNALQLLATDMIVIAAILLGLEAVVVDAVIRIAWRVRTRWADSIGSRKYEHLSWSMTK